MRGYGELRKGVLAGFAERWWDTTLPETNSKRPWKGENPPEIPEIPNLENNIF